MLVRVEKTIDLKQGEAKLKWSVELHKDNSVSSFSLFSHSLQVKCFFFYSLVWMGFFLGHRPAYQLFKVSMHHANPANCLVYPLKLLSPAVQIILCDMLQLI